MKKTGICIYGEDFDEEALSCSECRNREGCRLEKEKLNRRHFLI